jgi:hypothetical protein
MAMRGRRFAGRVGYLDGGGRPIFQIDIRQGVLEYNFSSTAGGLRA